MKLKKVRVQNYRSIRDTGDIDVEKIKTILVGPNEAGKTALLHVNPGVKGAIRRSKSGPVEVPRLVGCAPHKANA